MTLDKSGVQFSSLSSSNEILQQGQGSFTVPTLPGNGDVFGFAVIPHPYGSDDLIVQVATNGGPQNNVILPWASNDGRVNQFISIDATNLYIYCNFNDSSGIGSVGFTINYTYRLLVP